MACLALLIAASPLLLFLHLPFFSRFFFSMSPYKCAHLSSFRSSVCGGKGQLRALAPLCNLKELAFGTSSNVVLAPRNVVLTKKKVGNIHKLSDFKLRRVCGKLIGKVLKRVASLALNSC